MDLTIYDVAPDFPFCFNWEGKMYFATQDAAEELKELGMKVWIRKNHTKISVSNI